MSRTSCGMMAARCSAVMGAPMGWEMANILVVGTARDGAPCAKAGPANVIASNAIRSGRIIFFSV